MKLLKRKLVYDNGDWYIVDPVAGEWEELTEIEIFIIPNEIEVEDVSGEK